MYFGSAWQRPQVSATRTGCTLEVGSDGGLIECAGGQLVQTATLGSPCSLSRRPWGLPEVPLGRAQGPHPGLFGVAAGAGDASEPLGCVDVPGERLPRRREP